MQLDMNTTYLTPSSAGFILYLSFNLAAIAPVFE